MARKFVRYTRPWWSNACHQALQFNFYADCMNCMCEWIDRWIAQQIDTNGEKYKRERMLEMLRGACLKAIVVFQIKIPSRKEKM